MAPLETTSCARKYKTAFYSFYLPVALAMLVRLARLKHAMSAGYCRRLNSYYGPHFKAILVIVRPAYCVNTPCCLSLDKSTRY